MRLWRIRGPFQTPAAKSRTVATFFETGLPVITNLLTDLTKLSTDIK
jgi:hypothetical protein